MRRHVDRPIMTCAELCAKEPGTAARLPEGRDSLEARDAFRSWLDSQPSLRPGVEGKELECARA